MFSECIKEFCVQNKMPQCHLVAALDIDTATYCKIEKGERHARREHVEAIAQISLTDRNELVKLWFADNIYRLNKKRDNAAQILEVIQKHYKLYE